MLIPALQVFSIGFILGISGPCLLYCLPITLALGAGIKEGYKKVLFVIAVFLSGRVLAYTALGFLAGLSGVILRQFTGSNISFYFRPAAGVISILFGIYIFFYRQKMGEACSGRVHRVLHGGGSFVFGFMVGVSPCPPLIGLLTEIALVSKTFLQGAVYGLAFGLGTFFSGLILAAGITGVLNVFPKKFAMSPAANMIFRSICAAVLILFGVIFILG
ncbi:MAG: sulfite exporter TauE/SafE family protein [Candidatus Omnitrophica bacterium]|nr:sulfite exporter TauE/SafE family protein [Candidatus Omnitrophota bacterium]